MTKSIYRKSMLEIILSSPEFTWERFSGRRMSLGIFIMVGGRNDKLGSVLEHGVGPRRNTEGRYRDQ